MPAIADGRRPVPGQAHSGPLQNRATAKEVLVYLRRVGSCTLDVLRCACALILGGAVLSGGNALVAYGLGRPAAGEQLVRLQDSISLGYWFVAVGVALLGLGAIHVLFLMRVGDAEPTTPGDMRGLL